MSLGWLNAAWAPPDAHVEVEVTGREGDDFEYEIRVRPASSEATIEVNMGSAEIEEGEG